MLVVGQISPREGGSFSTGVMMSSILIARRTGKNAIQWNDKVFEALPTILGAVFIVTVSLVFLAVAQ